MLKFFGIDFEFLSFFIILIITININIVYDEEYINYIVDLLLKIIRVAYFTTIDLFLIDFYHKYDIYQTIIILFVCIVIVNIFLEFVPKIYIINISNICIYFVFVVIIACTIQIILI
jgi:hypothetical protein